MPGCGTIILAAGGSTRLGEPKQLVRCQGETLLERAVRTAVAANHQPILVVLGASAEACAEALQDQPVQIVKNDRWQEGLASSIRAGISHISHISDISHINHISQFPEVDGVLLMLCDQPLLTAEVLTMLATSGAGIAASGYGATAGPPIYFARRFFPELLTLQGEVGARALLRKFPDEVVILPFPEGLSDVDTPEDREKWLSGQTLHIQMPENPVV